MFTLGLTDDAAYGESLVACGESLVAFGEFSPVLVADDDASAAALLAPLAVSTCFDAIFCLLCLVVYLLEKLELN